jgi:hypothetical protein
VTPVWRPCDAIVANSNLPTTKMLTPKMYIDIDWPNLALLLAVSYIAPAAECLMGPVL